MNHCSTFLSPQPRLQISFGLLRNPRRRRLRNPLSCSHPFAGMRNTGKRHEQHAFTGGRPPIGFRVVEDEGKKVLAVDPDEAAIVRDVFASYLGPEPMGLKSIAKRLNDRGIPTRSMRAERQGQAKMIRRINRVRSATPWTKSSIRSILDNPVYTGLVVYNRRHMKLNRKTGNRIPVRNDESAQLSYREDRLRIIADEQFAAVKAKLESRKRSTSGQARSADLLRTFTGHLFCESCGSAFYSRKSENSKGVYVYYQCGCRQRNGPEACGNRITLREDKLLDGLRDVCSEVFADIDGMVHAALFDATATAQSNRTEATRIRAELAQVDKEIGSASALLVDPDVMGEPLARKAVLWKAADLEGKREGLQSSLDRLLDKSNVDTDQLAKIVRGKLLEAKERWEAVASPAQLNQLIGELVGPSLVSSDGRLLPVEKEKPAHANDDVHGVIAGAGSDPACAIVATLFRQQMQYSAYGDLLPRAGCYLAPCCG